MYSPGNIRVFCRCRPLNKGELAAGCTTVVDFDAAKDGCLGILTAASAKKSFKFDRVYTPKDNQGIIFLSLDCLYHILFAETIMNIGIFACFDS